MVPSGWRWTGACLALVGRGPCGSSMDGGACCRDEVLTQLWVCSWQGAVVQWGCRLAGRSNGGGAEREVLDGGVLDDGATGKGQELPSGGWVVLAQEALIPRGASPESPLARAFYPATCNRGALRSPPRPPWLGYRVPLAPSYSGVF